MAESRNRAHMVRIWQFPKAIFAWPLAVLCLLFVLFYQLGVRAEWLAWGQFLVLAAVFLTMALDIDIQALAILGLIFLVGLFCNLWLTQAFALPIFQLVLDTITGLNLQFGPATALMWGGLGLFLVLYSFCRVLYDGRWRMTPNELQHDVLLQRRRAFARGAKTVEAEYPDLLEFLLGLGSGTLIVRDSRSRQEINRIEHVVGLAFQIRKLDRILELREVVDFPHDDFEDEDEMG